MPLQDRSGKQKNPGGDESRPSDKCLKSIKDWLCRIGTVEVLTAVLAFAALVQLLWGCMVCDGGEDGVETCQEPTYTYAN